MRMNSADTSTRKGAVIGTSFPFVCQQNCVHFKQEHLSQSVVHSCRSVTLLDIHLHVDLYKGLEELNECYVVRGLCQGYEKVLHDGDIECDTAVWIQNQLSLLHWGKLV